MPVMTGIELLAKVRKISKMMNIPIIMISTANESEVVLEAITLGANSYIIKPFSPDILKEKVEDCLNFMSSKE
jgi:two-component system, chemotaxis family, chemotaxis protein CheY